mgnify:CR=1 FL=1
MKTAPDVPDARFDKSQIEQVLVNLCDNGLRYSQQQLGERKIELRVGATADGERAYVDVRDFGPGVATGTSHSIFEPFYTTKTVGNGAGLGLSIAYGIIQKHQGELTVESESQVGSCFNLILPVERDEDKEVV